MLKDPFNYFKLRYDGSYGGADYGTAAPSDDGGAGLPGPAAAPSNNDSGGNLGDTYNAITGVNSDSGVDSGRNLGDTYNAITGVNSDSGVDSGRNLGDPSDGIPIGTISPNTGMAWSGTGWTDPSNIPAPQVADTPTNLNPYNPLTEPGRYVNYQMLHPESTPMNQRSALAQIEPDRPGFTPMLDLGDKQTQVLISRGYSPQQALLIQQMSAKDTPTFDDDRFFANEYQKSLQNVVEMSSAKHAWGMETGLPTGPNEYEYAGDLALGLLKGNSGKSGAQVTTPINLGVLGPSGKNGAQNISWDAARRGVAPDFSELVYGTNVLARAMSAGTMGDYGNLRSYSSVFGELSLSQQQVIGYRAAKSAGEPINLDALFNKNPSAGYEALGYGNPYIPIVQATSKGRISDQTRLSAGPGALAGLPAPFISVGKSPTGQEIGDAGRFDPLGATGGFVRSMFQVGPVNIADAVSKPETVAMFPPLGGIAFWANMPGAKPQSNQQQAQFQALDTLGADYAAKSQEASRLETMAANFPRDTSGKILYDPTIPAQADWAQKYAAASQAQNLAFTAYKDQQTRLENQGAIRNTGDGKYEITSPFAGGYEFGEFSRWSEGAGKQLQAIFRLNPAELERNAAQPGTPLQDSFIMSAQATTLRDPGQILTGVGQGALFAAALAPSSVGAAIAGTAKAPGGAAGGSAIVRFGLPAAFVGMTGYEVTSGLTDFTPKGVAIKGGQMLPGMTGMLAGGAGVSLAPRGANAARGVFDRSAATFQRTFGEKPSAMMQTIAERNIFVQENPLAVSGQALRIEEVRTTQQFQRGKWLPSFFEPRPIGAPTVTKATTTVDINQYAGARLVNQQPKFGDLIAREYEVTQANLGRAVNTGRILPNQQLRIDLAQNQGKPELFNKLGKVYKNAEWERSTPVTAERLTYGGYYEQMVEEPVSIFRPYKIRQGAVGTMEEGVTMENVFQRGKTIQQEGDITGTTKIRPIRDISEFVLSTQRQTIVPKTGKFPFSVEEMEISRTFSENLRGISNYEMDTGRLTQRSMVSGKGITSEFDYPLMQGTTKKIREMLGTTVGKRGEFTIGEGQRVTQNIMDRIVIARDMEATISLNQPGKGYRAPQGKKGMAPSNPFKTPLSETFRRNEPAAPPIRPAEPPRALLQTAPESVTIRREVTRIPEKSYNLPTLEQFNPFRNQRFSLAEETMIIAPAAAAIISQRTGMNRQGVGEELALKPIAMSATRQQQGMRPATLELPSFFQSQINPLQAATFQGTRQGRAPDTMMGVVSDTLRIPEQMRLPVQTQRQAIDQRFVPDILLQNPTPQFPGRVRPPVEPTRTTPFGGFLPPAVPGGYGGGGGGYRGRETWTRTNNVIAMMLTRNAGRGIRTPRIKVPRFKLPRF